MSLQFILESPFSFSIGCLVLFVMFLIARHDYRTFEIHYGMLAFSTCAMVLLIALMEGINALAGSFLTAAILGGATLCIQWFYPGKIGIGDIPLMAFIGFVSGDETVWVVLALIIFSTMTAAVYSIQRGKKLFKSMFPMALPGMLAAGFGLIIRFILPLF